MHDVNNVQHWQIKARVCGHVVSAECKPITRVWGRAASGSSDRAPG